MSTFLLIMQFLPVALQIVQQVEGIVQGAKQGSVKKDLAVGLVKSGLDVAVKAGGLKSADAEIIKGYTPDLVDTTVSVLNTAGVLKHQEQS